MSAPGPGHLMSPFFPYLHIFVFFFEGRVSIPGNMYVQKHVYMHMHMSMSGRACEDQRIAFGTTHWILSTLIL